MFEDFLDAVIVVSMVFLAVRVVDYLYITIKYRKMAVDCDWNNQFQVQRLVTSVIHDTKLNATLKKQFLSALAEDCTRHGYDTLAIKALEEINRL